MPMARPMLAVVHSPAAVVSPVTWEWFRVRMVPAPRKPMPEMTWALTRRGSLEKPRMYPV